MLLSYASLLEKQTIALAEAERLLADAPTTEHRQLVDEMHVVATHLERLVGRIADRFAKEAL